MGRVPEPVGKVLCAALNPGHEKTVRMHPFGGVQGAVLEVVHGDGGGVWPENPDQCGAGRQVLTEHGERVAVVGLKQGMAVAFGEIEVGLGCGHAKGCLDSSSGSKKRSATVSQA